MKHAAIAAPLCAPALRSRSARRRWECTVRLMWLAIAITMVASLSARPLTTAPASGAVETPLDAAAGAIYNAEYPIAERMIRSFLKEHPDDLRAWNYLAEVVLDQEMLREGLYSGTAYLNSGTAFRQRVQALSPRFTAELNDALDHAQQGEQRRLAHNPNDQEALYWLGVTYSTRAEFAFALERSYFTALREGRKAWDANVRLRKLNPNCADAGLVIGLAEYTAGVLPWYFKVVASIAGIHGSRSQGIAELKRASAGGRYTRVDAKIVLVVIDERERQFAQARALVEELEKEYPLNYLAPLELGRIDQSEGDGRGAAAVYDRAVTKFVRSDSRRPDVPRALILLRAGQAHEQLGDFAAALNLYREAGNLGAHSPETYRAELAAAELDQRLNHLSTARREYQAVIDAAPGSEMAQRARHALRELH